MIEIGKINTLLIERTTTVGLYLSDEMNTEVLLPKKYILPEHVVGEHIDVFIYKDSEDRLIATTEKPFCEVNQFAHLNVSEVTRVGAFLDWGLEKDLLVPYKEQKREMHEGYSYVVYVYLDELSNRIVASSKVNKFISNEILSIEQGQEVDLLVYDETQLGYNCIINSQHKGLIYHNDVYQEIQIGNQLKGYVKEIRPGNLIDLSLQKIGFKHVLSSTDVILKYLQEHDGFAPFNDKTGPQVILDKFNMSKATFKKSIGILYRHRKITLGEDGIRLVG